MKHFTIPRAEASLDDHEAYVGAYVRQLFQTIDADDATGVNECLDRIGFYLENWVFLRLLDSDQRWHAGVWWIDGISARPADVILPNRLRMRGNAYMCLIHEQNPPPQLGKFDCALCEPYEFELELSPTTGSVARYRFRFGDDRPVAEKQLDEPVGDAQRNWIFTFYRRCTEAEWKALRPASEKYTTVGSPYEDLDDDDFSRAGTIAHLARRTAISARLLMRAEKANDSEAYEICMSQLRYDLLSSLSFHLRVDPDWDWRSGTRSIERLGEALPDVRTPNRLTLRDEAVVSCRGLVPSREPVCFDIELQPDTSDMCRYTYRFGKKEHAASSDQWQYVFHWPS